MKLGGAADNSIHIQICDSVTHHPGHQLGQPYNHKLKRETLQHRVPENITYNRVSGAIMRHNFVTSLHHL